MKPEIRFYLLLCSKDKDPSFISSELGLSPTSSNSKGEQWRKNQKYPEHVWQLSTELIKTHDLDDAIKPIYEKILPKKEALKQLILRHGIEAYFNSVVHVYGNQTPAMHLAKYIIEFAAECGIEFDFDTYVFDEED